MDQRHLLVELAHSGISKALAIAVVSLIAIAPASVSAAVTVSSFSAKVQATQIVLTWTTASEINNAGFNLYRSTSPNGPWTTKINPSLIPAQCPICIVSNKTYSYTDGSIAANQTYYYKLGSVDLSGGTQQFGPVSAGLPSQATATATLPPATVAPTLPVATSVPTGTPTPTATGTTIAPRTATRTSALVNAATVSPPTQAAKFAQPRANATPMSGTNAEVPDSATPGLTLVALGKKESTPEPEIDSAPVVTDNPALDSTSTRSYYLSRLVSSTVLLATAALLFGALVLSALSFFFFLRAYLR